MASIVNDPGDRKRLSIVESESVSGRRVSIRLGIVNDDVAKEHLRNVRQILACVDSPHLIPAEVLKWAASLPNKLYDRYARAQILPPRAPVAAKPAAMTLGKFLDRLFETLSVKPATKINYSHTQRNLLDFFGKDLALRVVGEDGELCDSISDERAAQFRAWLLLPKATTGGGEGLSRATVGRRIVSARNFFKRAAKWGYVAANPFADIKGGAQRNDHRKFFVSRAIIDQVIDACPDAEWRAIVALARYGGLRVPSEVFAMELAHVNVAERRILVHSPKTEHHPGHETRLIPLFPELESYLVDLINQAAPGQKYLIERHRHITNMGTLLGKIIRRTGLKPWPRLFQNLRASRETELFKLVPIERACEWIGNSPAVAVVHYLNDPDKDAHFQQMGAADPKATRIPTRKPTKTGANREKPEGPATPETAFSGELATVGGGNDWAIQDANAAPFAGELGGEGQSDALSDARGAGEGVFLTEIEAAAARADLAARCAGWPSTPIPPEPPHTAADAAEGSP